MAHIGGQAQPGKAGNFSAVASAAVTGTPPMNASTASLSCSGNPVLITVTGQVDSGSGIHGWALQVTDNGGSNIIPANSVDLNLDNFLSNFNGAAQAQSFSFLYTPTAGNHVFEVLAVILFGSGTPSGRLSIIVQYN